MTVEKDGWYMMAALPWSTLGLNDATLGTKLRFNLIRNRLGSRPEVSTWGPIKSGYRDLEQFGTITLGAFNPGQGRYDEVIVE